MRAVKSAGTFCNYFDDRDQLIQAVVPDVIDSVAAEGDAAVEERNATVRCVHRPLSRYVNALADHGFVVERIDLVRGPSHCERPGRRWIHPAGVDPVASFARRQWVEATQIAASSVTDR